jgi:transketolase
MLNTAGPTGIICSRQKVPILDRKVVAPAKNLHKGAYVLSDPPKGKPQIILIATGSEVWRAIEAATRLTKKAVRVRVVNFPSWELFEKQPKRYRESVLPPAMRKRLVIEAASPVGWEKYAGRDGEVLGLHRFGASAPGEEALDKLGFAVEHIVKRALALLKE